MVQEKKEEEKDFMAMFFYAVKTRAQPHLRLPTKATKSKSAEFLGGIFFWHGPFYQRSFLLPSNKPASSSWR